MDIVRTNSINASESNNGTTNNSVTFQLEGDFDTRAERAVRRMINRGTIQEGLNRTNVENGGAPLFRRR